MPTLWAYHHQDVCRRCGDFINHREIVEDGDHTRVERTPGNGAGHETRPRYGKCAKCARDQWQWEQSCNREAAANSQEGPA